MDTLKAGKTQDALIADHLNSLRRHLRRKLAKEQDVQDLTQEACLRLLHASRSNRVDNPRAYLYQIANRLLLQHYSAVAQRSSTPARTSRRCQLHNRRSRKP